MEQGLEQRLPPAPRPARAPAGPPRAASRLDAGLGRATISSRRCSRCRARRVSRRATTGRSSGSGTASGCSRASRTAPCGSRAGRASTRPPRIPTSRGSRGCCGRRGRRRRGRRARRAGRPDFGLLQQRMNLTKPREIAAAAAAVPVTLHLFDVLEVGRHVDARRDVHASAPAPRAAVPRPRRRADRRAAERRGDAERGARGGATAGARGRGREAAAFALPSWRSQRRLGEAQALAHAGGRDRRVPQGHGQPRGEDPLAARRHPGRGGCATPVESGRACASATRSGCWSGSTSSGGPSRRSSTCPRRTSSTRSGCGPRSWARSSSASGRTGVARIRAGVACGPTSGWRTWCSRPDRGRRHPISEVLPAEAAECEEMTVPT